MMTPDRDCLETFVAQWIATKSPKCQAFMLANVAGMTSAPLDTLELGRKPDATAMVDRIEQSAAAHLAASGQKKQRYTLAAFSKDSKVLGQHFFAIEADVNELQLLAPGMSGAMNRYWDSNGEDEMAGNMGAGLAKVASRHQQEMTRIYMGAFGALMTNMAQQVDRMSRRTASIEQRHMDALKLTEELLSRKHDRELEHKEQTAELERQERTWLSLEKFMPIIAARMTGATDLSDLFRSLNEEKRAQLFGALDDDQAQTMRRIFSQDEDARQAIDELLNKRRIEAAPAAE